MSTALELMQRSTLPSWLSCLFRALHERKPATLDGRGLAALLSWLGLARTEDARQLQGLVGAAGADQDLLAQVFAMLDDWLFEGGQLHRQRAGVGSLVPLPARRRRYRLLLSAYHPDRFAAHADYLTGCSQAILAAYRDFKVELDGRGPVTGSGPRSTGPVPASGMAHPPPPVPTGRRPRPRYTWLQTVKRRWGSDRWFGHKLVALLALLASLPVLDLFLAPSPSSPPGLEMVGTPVPMVVDAAPQAVPGAPAVAIGPNAAPAIDAIDSDDALDRGRHEPASAARLRVATGQEEAGPLAAEPAQAVAPAPSTPAQPAAVAAGIPESTSIPAPAAAGTVPPAGPAVADSAPPPPAPDSSSSSRAAQTAATVATAGPVPGISGEAVGQPASGISGPAAPHQSVAAVATATEPAAASVSAKRSVPAADAAAAVAPHMPAGPLPQSATASSGTPSEMPSAPPGAVPTAAATEAVVAAGVNLARDAADDLVQRQDDLVRAYQRSIESGDLAALAVLLADNARENNHDGRDALLGMYRGMFQRSRERSLALVLRERWPESGGWVIRADYQLRVRFPDQQQISRHGQVHYRLREEGGGMVITAIDY